MENGMDLRAYCLSKLENQRRDMLLIRQMAQPKVVDALNKRIAVLNEIFNFEQPISIREVRPAKKTRRMAVYA